ncbi:MAG: hypothetical protein A3G60_01445 [Candidatus Ryanbacteria bacterium RIFCSPLOWO2_12_FULL_47_9c]|uniref:Uncharacterized protein n=2 Tax=Candidatus Ryaniibacteriota TaxID=1817914 RepID=A0A1G2H484_9BACT|nr:MAG: hypothetical protein A2844_02180 [Candidatus Ryanbacteria bacterium RIFCSPHIGHO2_01_FULL_48_80]OGZ48044.1 MAG: hypothetical protein A3C83_02765 [Candidatus Ryanbacteria bacterium RIFCSPHIGHO2_02_FULL_47_25]OGZ51361.1 MAG: hypothetical protein A3A29_01990 [Candidatus Ryanbacteria bacterium RIFCSPLOWO2_01_FULL_47_79]OGZ54839.1 MAG: hypothetical protein A3J04_02445 [Candidatus Ryanbacteria bacterium RIFCSPLOWO2_02_FULL_47_14]OGZ57292.1 MAG: hypothetical protein A3G60_01445 [Candidatus Ryan
MPEDRTRYLFEKKRECALIYNFIRIITTHARAAWGEKGPYQVLEPEEAQCFRKINEREAMTSGFLLSLFSVVDDYE